MTIYKYPIEIKDYQVIVLPLNSEILTAQTQHGTLCLWAKVEEINTDTEEHTIEIFGTGNPMGYLTPAQQRKYLGTVQMAGGSLVWHVFELL